MELCTLRDSAKAVTLFLIFLILVSLVGSTLNSGIALVFWSAIVAAVVLTALVLARNVKQFTTRSVLPVILVVLPSIIGVAAVLRFLSHYDGGIPIQFTRNDMVMNTIEALTIHRNGGLGVGDEVKPVFLTAVISSLFYGPGTSFVPLLTMLYGNIAAATTVSVVASIFSAWFAFLSLKQAPLPVRILGTLVVGWVPFTRHLFGAVQYNGYMNIPLIYLILILTWVIYRTLKPAQALIWLPLLVITTLATWSPASLIPGFVLLVTACRFFIDASIDHPTRKEYVWMGLTWGSVALYFFTISLPSLRADGDYLAAGPGNLGGEFADRLLTAAIILLLLFLLVAVIAPHRRSADVMGLGAVTMGGWLAVFFLLLMRDAGDTRWGYYPLKMLWISTLVFATIMTVETLVKAFSEDRSEDQATQGKFYLRRFTHLALAVVIMAAGVLLPSEYLGLRKTVLPIIARDANIPSLEQKRLYDQLVEVFDSRPGEPVVFIRQASEPAYDGDRNRFLIQFSAPTDHDVRIHAYRDWDKKYYQLLCPLLRAWDKDATIVTSSNGLEKTKQQVQQCNAYRHTVQYVVLDQ
ncbi:hypothetical protein [Schaalia suimastitidis]|uniref:hypothetical protein n=1 Tax=Schaalia suimastitidis TaxID=121163 RepID=UPI00041A2D7A|nr:hypothetical protein [Schaalia suimastitidis]